MKKKYTKAKVEIISMKTEAFICKSPAATGGGSGLPAGEGSDPNPEEEEGGFETAKAFDGNGINDFSFDPTPSTKE